MHTFLTNPRTRLILLSISIMLTMLLLAKATTVLATPSSPVTLINHTLKQCAPHVIMSDECWHCQPSPGWEVLPAGQCPADYALVDEDPKECQSYANAQENPYCSPARYPLDGSPQSAFGGNSNSGPDTSNAPTTVALISGAVVAVTALALAAMRKRK